MLCEVEPRPDGPYDIVEPSLAEWLRVDQKAMRQMLDRLAFEAHRDQPNLVGAADISQDTLVGQLMPLNLNPDARPARLIESLRDRGVAGAARSGGLCLPTPDLSGISGRLPSDRRRLSR
jgi:hypothetical protein